MPCPGSRGRDRETGRELPERGRHRTPQNTGKQQRDREPGGEPFLPEIRIRIRTKGSGTETGPPSGADTRPTHPPRPEAGSPAPARRHSSGPRHENLFPDPDMETIFQPGVTLLPGMKLFFRPRHGASFPGIGRRHRSPLVFRQRGLRNGSPEAAFWKLRKRSATGALPRREEAASFRAGSA